MEGDDFDYLFKVVLIGESLVGLYSHYTGMVIGDMGVGKTCAVQRFKNGTFIEKQGMQADMIRITVEYIIQA
jgi:Ras-related protein Rab-43